MAYAYFSERMIGKTFKHVTQPLEKWSNGIS